MALVNAIASQRWRQIQLLINLNTNINSPLENGRTALIETCFLQNDKKAVKIFKQLLKRGAKTGIKDALGMNALAHACELQRNTLVSLMLERRHIDFDINGVDLQGQTPLFHACKVGNYTIVKKLVETLCYFRLSVDVQNDLGETPLMVCFKHGFNECADILIKKGKASLCVQDNVEHLNALEWGQNMLSESVKNMQLFNAILDTSDTNAQAVRGKNLCSKKIPKSAPAVEKCHLPNIYAPTRFQSALGCIKVPYSLQACTPISEDIKILYGMYNEQNSSSYRKSYKRIRYRTPVLPEPVPDVEEGPSEIARECSVKFSGMISSVNHWKGYREKEKGNRSKTISRVTVSLPATPASRGKEKRQATPLRGCKTSEIESKIQTLKIVENILKKQK